jgi:hypothetical protein
MMRARSLLVACFGLALLLSAVLAQSAAANRIEQLGVSNVTPTSATAEASIGTEGEETAL